MDKRNKKEKENQEVSQKDQEANQKNKRPQTFDDLNEVVDRLRMELESFKESSSKEASIEVGRFRVELDYLRSDFEILRSRSGNNNTKIAEFSKKLKLLQKKFTVLSSAVEESTEEVKIGMVEFTSKMTNFAEYLKKLALELISLKAKVQEQKEELDNKEEEKEQEYKEDEEAIRERILRLESERMQIQIFTDELHNRMKEFDNEEIEPLGISLYPVEIKVWAFDVALKDLNKKVQKKASWEKIKEEATDLINSVCNIFDRMTDIDKLLRELEKEKRGSSKNPR